MTYTREMYNASRRPNWSADDLRAEFDRVQRGIPWAQCVDAREIGLSQSQSAAKNLEMLNRVLPAVTERGFFIDLAGLTYPISPFSAGANLRLRNGTLDFTDAGAASCIQSTGGSTGSDVDISSDVAAGDLTVTLDSVSGLSEGDYLRLTSDEDWNVAGDIHTSEIVRIKSISGTTCTLYEPVDYSYATADSAVAAKVTYVDGWHFHDVSLEGDPATLTLGLNAQYLRGATFENCYGSGFRSRAFQLRTGRRCTFVNPQIEDGDPNAVGGGLNYGVALVEGCHDIGILGGSATNVRHAVTLGGTGVINRYVRVIGMAAIGTLDAGFDCHSAADLVTFSKVQIQRRSGSSIDGIISQSARTMIDGVQISGPGASRNCVFIQPLVVAAVAVSANVSNVRADGDCASLVSIRNAGTTTMDGCTVTGVTHVDRTNPVTDQGVQIYAEDGSIRNVVIGDINLDGSLSRGVRIRCDTGHTIVGGSIIGGRIRLHADSTDECISINGTDADSVTDFVVDGFALEGGAYGVRAPTTASSVARIVLGPAMVYNDHTTADFRITGTGSKVAQQQEVSDDNGDAAKTLTVGIDEREQVWSTELTADRAVTLSTTGAVRGAEFHIVRPATGAFNLNVGTGPLKALAAGEECWVRYNGSAWYLSAAGSL